MKKEQKYCHKCSQLFSCGGNCWCMNFPTILKIEQNSDCLCPTCLTQKMKKTIDDFLIELTPDKINQVKALGKSTHLTQGIDYTINEKGLYIFSKWYLLRRGNCCGNGCLNCPY